MSFRQYDFLCWDCNTKATHLVDVPGGGTPAKHYKLECKRCGKETGHERVMSAPAVYVYDRPYAPIVYGGKFDTMGYKNPPRLPDIPDGAAFDQARDILTSKKWDDKAKERLAQHRENEIKRKRAAAMRKGEGIDIRKNPLPGDPPLDRVGKGKKIKAVR